MKRGKSLYLIVAIVIVIWLLKPFYVLYEGEQSVVVRFGKMVDVQSQAGLKFKMPLVDRVTRYPKRIQSWDGAAQRLPTEENQFIWVDTTARWQISDPKLFYEAVGSIAQAQSRLDDVIDSGVRKVIARNHLREAVRNSNIINEIERRDVFASSGGEDGDQKGISLIASTFTNMKYPEIGKGREKLSEEMLKEAKAITPEYGIDLIDIIIRQIKYSDDLTQSVYNRMIKERNQVAQAFRSDGEGKRAEWLGRREKELRTIHSEAVRKSKELRAKADAEALEIRNRAYNQDQEFAEFWMALVEYQKLLPKMRKTLTTDMEFFKYLYKK